jgi:lysophospholipase L1-like esterase
MKRFGYLRLSLLILALCVSNTAAQIYERANLWQKEIDAFTEIDRRQTPPASPVLFVGSSSFRMWTTVREDFPNVNIINRGFGGSHLEDVIHYAAQTISPFRAKTVVIYAGDNDITAGKTVERVFADYKTLVGVIRQTSPNAKIIFVSIKPSPSRREFWTKFQQLNALVKAETVKDKRLLLADVWSKMLTASGEPREELYLPDRLHMKPAGYAIWRDVLREYLK